MCCMQLTEPAMDCLKAQISVISAIYTEQSKHNGTAHSSAPKARQTVLHRQRGALLTLARQSFFMSESQILDQRHTYNTTSCIFVRPQKQQHNMPCRRVVNSKIGLGPEPRFHQKNMNVRGHRGHGYSVSRGHICILQGR